MLVGICLRIKIIKVIETIQKKSEVSGFVLERTAKRIKQYFQQQLAAADTGVTIDQWVVLQVLDKQDGASQLDIAKATFKDAPTITRIIDLLCKKELTYRSSDPKDRRRFQIFLTPAGKEKIAEVLPIIKAARDAAWAGLSDESIGQMVKVLDAVFDNLSEDVS